MPLRCVPPQNRPTAAELTTCRPFMARELALLPNVQMMLCLGGIAFEQTLRLFREQGTDVPRLKFNHGAHYELGTDSPDLLCCYHPSLQNTNTGRLTPEMMDEVLARVRYYLRP